MQIRFIISPDWTAMYVDGKKVYEGHRLHPDEALTLAGLTVLPAIEAEVDDGHDFTFDAFPDEIDMETGKAID